MKMSRGFVGAAWIVCSLSFVLGGCGGSGEYRIPNVAPVVKQKPDDSLLENIEGTDSSSSSTPSAPTAATPAEAKPADAKPAEAKPAEPKGVETKPLKK